MTEAAHNVLDRSDREVHNLIFSVQRSYRYHDRRVAHFDWLHRLTNVTAILLSGVVLMELLGASTPWPIKILGLAGAIFGTADLVVGFSRRANEHRDLKRRFIELDAQIERNTLAFGEAKAERLKIETDEPPKHFALDLLVHNELCAARGHNRKKNPEHFATVKWYQRWTAQWWRWQNIDADA